MPRTITRMSPHGYPIYEKVWNQEINDCIHGEGLEVALSRYPEDDVTHHLGGEQYGAEIGDDYVVAIHNFDNLQHRTWEEVEPIIELFKDIKTVECIGAIHSSKGLTLQVKLHRLFFSEIMTKVGKAIMTGLVKMDVNAVKHMPYNAAIQVPLRKPSIAEMKSSGLTDAEISEREGIITSMGYTTDDTQYGDYKLRLLLNEIEKLGFNPWGGESA